MQSIFNAAGQFLSSRATKINTLPLLKLLSYLTIVFILWRFITLDFVETSGDAVWKWAFLRHYCESGVWFPATPDHHQGRWMINMPVLGLMKLFGPQNLYVYYLYPLLTAYGAAVAAFLITRELASQAAATATFVGCLLFTLIVRESTQFLPMLPAACYMAWAIYCLKANTSDGWRQQHFWYFFPTAAKLRRSTGRRQLCSFCPFTIPTPRVISVSGFFT